MRFILSLLVACALAAGGYHLSQTDGIFAAGFYRPLDVSVSLIALGAIGLLAARSGDKGWVAAAIGFAATMIAAALTPRGLELPEIRALMVATLFLLGLFGAMNGAPGVATAALVLAIAGATHGHVMSDGLAAAAQGMFLAGFAMGTGTAILAGMALGQAADRLSGGLSAKLAAGVAGVGLYLTCRHFGFL